MGATLSGNFVGITATREGATPAQLATLIDLLCAWEPDELHHGRRIDSITGRGKMRLPP